MKPKPHNSKKSWPQPWPGAGHGAPLPVEDTPSAHPSTLPPLLVHLCLPRCKHSVKHTPCAEHAAFDPRNEWRREIYWGHCLGTSLLEGAPRWVVAGTARCRRAVTWHLIGHRILQRDLATTLTQGHFWEDEKAKGEGGLWNEAFP